MTAEEQHRCQQLTRALKIAARQIKEKDLLSLNAKRIARYAIRTHGMGAKATK